MAQGASVFGGAGSIDALGTPTGPCDPTCAHRYCIVERAIATSACLTCAEPIGYNRRFTVDAHGERRHEACVAPETPAALRQRPRGEPSVGRRELGDVEPLDTLEDDLVDAATLIRGVR